MKRFTSPNRLSASTPSQSGEDLELPADAPQRAPETVPPAAEILHDAELDPELNREEGACLVLPPHQLPSPPVEPPGHVVAVVSTLGRPMLSKPTIAKLNDCPLSARVGMA